MHTWQRMLEKLHKDFLSRNREIKRIQSLLNKQDQRIMQTWQRKIFYQGTVEKIHLCSINNAKEKINVK